MKTIKNSIFNGLFDTCVILIALGIIGVNTCNAALIDDGGVLPSGAPTWKAIDFQLFAGTIGTPENGFQELANLGRELLPLPNHQPCPDTSCAVLPGAVHSGYDQELSAGMTNLGLVSKTIFSAADFTAPKGIILGWMMVPDTGSPTGSSVDGSPNGHIIANATLPITIDGDLYRNGILYDAAFDFQAGGIAGVDGYSHFPLFIAENKDISGSGITDPTGQYEFRLKLTDTSGKGLTYNIGFQVVPVPPAIWLFSSALGALGLIASRRKDSSRNN
jgi:hypothetical protein